MVEKIKTKDLTDNELIEKSKDEVGYFQGSLYNHAADAEYYLG